MYTEVYAKKQYTFQSVFVNMPRKRCVILHCTDTNAVRYGPKDVAQCEKWKELTKSNTDWKGANFRTFLVCENHFSEAQFQRSYFNELLGLGKKRKLVTGAFPDKIKEEPVTIKVILALHNIHHVF